MSSEATIQGPVVAGWSGSEVSARVLDVAAGFAQRHSIPMHVVLAWDLLDQPGGEWDPAITGAKVEAQLDAALEPVRAAHPDITVTRTAELGWPPKVVAEAAAEAGLLVVGRSAKSESHFGDWSPDVLVRRVRCPVVWVP